MNPKNYRVMANRTEKFDYLKKLNKISNLKLSYTMLTLATTDAEYPHSWRAMSSLTAVTSSTSS